VSALLLLRRLTAAEPEPALVALVRRAALAVVVAGVVGVALVGPGTAPRAELVPVGTEVAAPGFTGFSEEAFTVQPGPDLPVYPRARCAVAASTAAARAAGLSGRGGFGGYAGMLFTFPEPTTDVFSMAHITIPLSVAWFDGTGRFVGEAGMAPCPGGVDCPYYHAPARYSLALEVPRGDLPDYGIGPGSILRTAGPCIT
jgi:uncharacterized membrane protein (UPF0127 family)